MAGPCAVHLQVIGEERPFCGADLQFFKAVPLTRNPMHLPGLSPVRAARGVPSIQFPQKGVPGSPGFGTLNTCQG